MRPWASRRVTLALHVAPGASAVHEAVMLEAEATEKSTPVHAAVGRTPTTSSGVRGSGLTSPLIPITPIVQLDPWACEHCDEVVPP